MKKLNEDGLKKALPYIEKILGVNGKFCINGGSIILNEFKLSVEIPDNWVISEVTDGPVGADMDPSDYVPAVSQAGNKDRETGVKKLGRAAVEREEEKKLEAMAKKLSDKFITIPDFEKHMKDFDKRTIDPKELQQVFQKMGSLLAR